MLYKLIGTIERTTVDTFHLEVDAEDPEEAQDLAYEVLSTYPDSDLKLDKLLRVDSQSERPTSISIEFVREETPSEEVFDSGEDEPDPPRYA